MDQRKIEFVNDMIKRWPKLFEGDLEKVSAEDLKIDLHWLADKHQISNKKLGTTSQIVLARKRLQDTRDHLHEHFCEIANEANPKERMGMAIAGIWFKNITRLTEDLLELSAYFSKEG